YSPAMRRAASAISSCVTRLRDGRPRLRLLPCCCRSSTRPLYPSHHPRGLIAISLNPYSLILSEAYLTLEVVTTTSNASTAAPADAAAENATATLASPPDSSRPRTLRDAVRKQRPTLFVDGGRGRTPAIASWTAALAQRDLPRHPGHAASHS